MEGTAAWDADVRPQSRELEMQATAGAGHVDCAGLDGDKVGMFNGVGIEVRSSSKLGRLVLAFRPHAYSTMLTTNASNHKNHTCSPDQQWRHKQPVGPCHPSSTQHTNAASPPYFHKHTANRWISNSPNSPAPISTPTSSPKSSSPNSATAKTHPAASSATPPGRTTCPLKPNSPAKHKNCSYGGTLRSH